MGLFEKLFKRPSTGINHNAGYWKLLDGYVPAYRTWSGQIYESELVRAAIDARARHISKLNIEFFGTAKGPTRRALMDRPNELQSWPQFLSRISTIYDVQNTAFAVPEYDSYGNIIAVYPIMPSGCDVISVNGEPWLRYSFMDGKRAAVRFADCTVLRQKQYKSDLFGDSNEALNDTMRLIDVQRQAIAEAAKQSSTYRFMARSNNFMKSEDLERERKRFNKNILESGEGGALLFPNTWTEIKQIDSKAYTVSADEQKVVQENIYNYFGVNTAVLQNSANGDALNAFYNGAVQPFAIQLSDAMTSMIFTKAERARGNRVMFNSNRQDYMSITEKIEMSRHLIDRGFLTIDEGRALFGYAPLPDGAGDFIPIRGEYHDVNAMNAEADQLYGKDVIPDGEPEPDGTEELDTEQA